MNLVFKHHSVTLLFPNLSDAEHYSNTRVLPTMDSINRGKLAKYKQIMVKRKERKEIK